MDKLFILKQRKKELKMTFEELSLASGIPLNTITDIFRGVTKNPRVDTMQAIERALGIDNQPQKVNQYDFTDDEIELVEAYRKILPSLKGYAKETVMRLAGMKMDEQRERKNG